MAVIITFVFYGDIFVYSQSGGDIVKQFQRAKDEYNNGQYVNAKNRLERIIGTIKDKGQEKKDITGACYLILGAIYEKEGETSLAEENYRRAKEYGVESIAGVDLNGLPLYRRVVKGEIDIDTPFKKAVEEYINGQYENSKKTLELVIGTIKEGKLDKEEISGQCCLLLGAIYEKKGETPLAEENYREAKEYGVESIEGIDLNGLTIYKRIVKGIIEKEIGRKKKKLIGALIVVGILLAIGYSYLKQSEKKNYYKLRVETGDGMRGNPENGIHTYKQGFLVNYEYISLKYDSDPVVTIDGNIVSSKGTILMVKDYWLTASMIKIHIESIPDKSEVYVDNQNKGILTPCDFSISSGRHDIRLVKNGYGAAALIHEVFEEDKVYNYKVELAGYIYSCVGSWGKEGSDPGEFRFPSGIATYNDKIYIADWGNNRIQIFKSNGDYDDKWGIEGDEDGQFKNPEDIAIDNRGFRYVLDSIGRVQKFDTNQDWKGTWRSDGTIYGKMDSPKGISVDQMDFVYVDDSKKNRILKFNSKGEIIGTLGTGLSLPADITIDKNNNAYVCDSNNKLIQKYDRYGYFLAQWGQNEKEKYDMINPYSITVDDNNYLYVCDIDPGKYRILKFDSNGKFICKWSTNNPRSIAVDKYGYVYVVDQAAHNFKKFKMSEDTAGENGKWALVTNTVFNSNSSIKTHSKFPDKNRDEKAERFEKFRNKKDRN